MKRLLLNRHAEAASPRGIKDFDRPLTAQGISQVQQLAIHLAHHSFIPDLWMSSTALRAQATAQIITNALTIQQQVTDSKIYEADEQTLLNIINAWNNKHDFIGLTGHNPGISYLLFNLCNEIRDVPPCTALLLTFEVDDWAHISGDMGTLRWYYTPH